MNPVNQSKSKLFNWLQRNKIKLDEYESCKTNQNPNYLIGYKETKLNWMNMNPVNQSKSKII